MDGVVPRKEFITKCHVVVIVTIEDIDEGEFRRVRTTDIIKFGECCQELIGKIIRQTAVQVNWPGMYEVVHWVHRIGKRHRVLRHTGTGHTRTTIHRSGIRSVPDSVLRIVVTQSQMMLVCDVPVNTGQQFVVALVCGETGPTACIVSVPALDEIRDSLQVRVLCTRNILSHISHTIRWTAPRRRYRRSLDHFTIDEKEKFVWDNRATERESVGSLTVLLTGSGKSHLVNHVTTQILIAVIDIGRTLESVRTRLRDGVHTTTYEIGLTDIVRGYYHLQFLNSIEWNGVTATR